MAGPAQAPGSPSQSQTAVTALLEPGPVTGDRDHARRRARLGLQVQRDSELEVHRQLSHRVANATVIQTVTVGPGVLVTGPDRCAAGRDSSSDSP